jgi:N-acetylneuraminic acid mutarotase
MGSFLRFRLGSLARASVLAVVAASGASAGPGPLAWSRLPDLPDPVGFAAPFAGASGGALIVAGGANFPERPPWEGGAKRWHDRVFVLPGPDAPAWIPAGTLGRPSAYGVSLTTDDGLLCIGGSDATRHFRDVFRLRWDGTRIRQEPHSLLPVPLAHACGALRDGRAYLAGGTEGPDAASASRHFLTCDLRAPEPTWTALPDCPGPGRMLAVAAVTGDGSFWLIGGTALRPGTVPGAPPAREPLRDAWRYRSDTGWSRLPDLPAPVIAAPSPAPLPEDRPLLLGGDDHAQVLAGTPPAEHPGFPRVARIHRPADGWRTAGPLPFGLVTTPVVPSPWHRDAWILPGGEIRPGIRSTEVWLGRPRP